MVNSISVTNWFKGKQINLKADWVTSQLSGLTTEDQLYKIWLNSDIEKSTQGQSFKLFPRFLKWYF